MSIERTDELRVENTFSWLKTDEALNMKLWRSLRFRDPNAFYNAAYRARKWDGYHEFYKRDSGRFLTGLMPEIMFALNKMQREYRVIDNTNTFTFKTDEIGEDYIKNETGLLLRDYQYQNATAAVNLKRGLVWAPTAAGKSAVLQAIVKACPDDAEVLVLGNKKGLVDQNYESLHSELGLDNVGRLYGGLYEPGRIVCATWQSCHKIVPFLNNVRALFVDEIHENMSKGIKRVYHLLKNASVRIGFSATPFVRGGSDNIQKYDVKGWIGAPFSIESAENGRLSAKDLQARGILSTSEGIFYVIEGPELSEYLTYADAVTQGIVENNWFHDVVARLVGGFTGRTLIIVDRIAHGDRLLDRIPNAAWVRGKDTMATRKAVIDRLKYDKDNVVAIATAGIFNTGINAYIHQLVNAAGGKAEHTIVQRLGRGLRRAPDKDHLVYIDFFFKRNKYLKSHSKERMSILSKEGHSVTVKEIDF